MIQLDVEVQESHLGKIADSMAEWEGPIAEKLNWKQMMLQVLRQRIQENWIYKCEFSQGRGYVKSMVHAHMHTQTRMHRWSHIIIDWCWQSLPPK